MTLPKVQIEWQVNIVSLANFIGLIALLITAIGTWYGLVGRVDMAQYQIGAITAELQQATQDFRGLNEHQNEISNRLSTIETRVEAQAEATKRIESQLDTLIRRP